MVYARPRRGPVWLSGVVTVIALAGMLLGSCASGEAATDRMPGYAEKTRSVNTEPFRFVEPESSGASTTILGPDPTFPLPPEVEDQVRPLLPGGGRGEYEPTPMIVPSTTTTVTVVRSTTTSVPMSPNESPNANPTSFCGFSEYLYSLMSIFFNPAIDVRRLATSAPLVVSRYLAVTPPKAKADAELVASTMVGIIDILRASNYNPNAWKVQATLTEIIQGAPKWQPFLQAFDRLKLAESAMC